MLYCLDNFPFFLMCKGTIAELTVN
jgi:hypothetical protein